MLRRTSVHRRGQVWRFAVSASLCAGLVACAADLPAPAADPAVTIDGERIEYRAFQDSIDRALQGQGLEGDEPPLDDAALSRLFDEFLDGQLLVRLAIERGLVDGDIDPRRAVAYLLRDLRQPIDSAEARAYYRAHRADFEHPEEVRLRQILVADRAVADEARAALDAGEDFAEVAARLSQGPKAHLGGDQGLLARADLPERFADLVFSLEAGETSPVVENDYGFQIFQVVERRPAESVPFEDALPEVRRALERRRIDEAVQASLAEARERYNVRLFPSQFPFDYRGSYAPSSDADPT